MHPDIWKHCSGKTNPADLPSRGMTLDELSISKLLYYGPEWLTTGEESPNWTDLSDMPEECNKELKIGKEQAHTLLLSVLVLKIGNLLTIERHATLQKLLRVTALVLKAAKLFKLPKENNMEAQAILQLKCSRKLRSYGLRTLSNTSRLKAPSND